MFVSRGAIRPMGTTWSEELRIVAANAWWLSAFTFEDFVAFDLAYQQELDSGGGAVLDQSACLRLWVAAWLNHGNGIRKWASLAQGGAAFLLARRPGGVRGSGPTQSRQSGATCFRTAHLQPPGGRRSAVWNSSAIVPWT